LRSARILWVIFLAACLAVTLIGKLYFDAQKRDIVARKGTELSAVRDLKIQQILDSRASLLHDGNALAGDPIARTTINAWLSSPNDVASETVLRAWLDNATGSKYSGALIVSADGSRWISSSGEATPGALGRAEARRALGSSDATLTELFLDPATGQPRLDVVAPLAIQGGQAGAALILKRDPHSYLFPLLQTWPTPSASSETLLVRREAANVLYLNDLRFRPNAALRSEVPLSETSLLAVQALNGPARTTEGTDYRGVPVYGAVGRVGDTDWYLVAKIDRSEAFAGVAEQQWLVAIAAVVVLSLLGLGLLYAWRQRAIEYYRRQLEVERSEALLSQQYGLLTRYASDAVILADQDLRIVQANERAVALYGYALDELLRMSLDDLLEPAEHGAPAASLASVLLGDSTALIEIRQRRADGSTLDAEMTTQAISVAGQVLHLTITRDVSARKAAEVALRESEEKFRSIVQSSPTAIYLYRLEPDGRLVLTSANPASDRIIGIEHSELIGKTIEEAFPNLADTDIPAMYRSVAAGDLASQSFEIPYQDDRFSGYYQVAVFQTAPNLVAVNFMDISERKRAEEELAARTEDLTRSNADLEKFAYIASHDLQEPLRMVASYTQLLQRRYQGRLDADADEFIGYAVDGATRMQRLINELLVYSRVGSQGSAFVETDLESVLADVLRVLTISIAESGAEVTHDPMPTVVCDPTQIGQVFQNLIVNAIKFRSEDPPRIHVGAESSGDEWVFTVKDNGLGIEPEYFDRIFVIFQRLQSRADYPGTGMGLAICKRIIERHGGRTWVESGEGIGSTFYFTLAAKGKDRHVGNL
jgi:PAS domain S-box-containing protein